MRATGSDDLDDMCADHPAPWTEGRLPHGRTGRARVPCVQDRTLAARPFDRTIANGFTLIELLVVISIIALLMAILIPSLGRAKKQAQAVACRANLRQWGLMLTMYAQDNQGSLPTGWNGGTMWMVDLLRYYQGEADVRLCPTAKRFLHEIPANTPGTFTAWGKYGDPGYFGGWTPPWGYKGQYGSYGINAWVHNPLAKGVAGTYDIAPAQMALHWRTITVTKTSEIPAFGDCMWDGADPRATDAPPPVEGQQVQDSGMTDFCINRHMGHTQLTFLDGSVRRVGLKQLWRLTWHRDYNLNVTPPRWPDWMRGLKDWD